MSHKGLYRRDGKLVYIKQPEFEELHYVRELWADYETMKDVGGIFNFSKEKWELFYKKMVSPTDGKNFYCLVYSKENLPVGEVSFHGYDSATKIARFNLRISSVHRSKGYGAEATRLMLEYFFYEFGGMIMMDTVSNTKRQNPLLNLGFEIVRRHNNYITYKLTKERFINNEHEHGEKRKVAFLLYEGVDLLSFAGVLETFSITNNMFGDHLFDLCTIGEKKGKVKTSSGVGVNIDYSFKEVLKINILIIPGGKAINWLFSNQELCKFIKNSYESCEIILGIDSGILLLGRCGILDNINTVIHERYIKELKEIHPKAKLIRNNIVDNGRVMLSANMINSIDLSLNVIKRLLGEEKALQVVKFLENRK
ncbi:hypothetical protein CPJCM30710_12810 [Clostridium polyendosporum]|uniref:N-acetyltransferase domain-containing protein n=1 Tax=Clostridium polyendosporum TaxID=69208 RepID=A0A919RZZ1_9CLOT|nr:GNAT family N-acetyltransferase [Clostridium polyendosporum]GIM28615.1 hypothetical protein CPJCM30710_12810 [Clostridium polyendosporum]